MKLEFGGGEKLSPGFIGCDVRDVENVKYVCNCWDIDRHVDEASVDEIYSRHMFEHLTFAQGKRTLEVWHKILRDGGKVHLIIPDLKYHVDEYIRFYNDRDSEDRGNNFFHAVKSIFGGQRETIDCDYFTTFNTTWDIHKSGYDETSLKHLVQSYGYKNFHRHNNSPWHLDVTFFKETT